MQDVRVKVKFYGDKDDHIINLIFKNDANITGQISHWLKSNLKGVEYWEFC